MKKERKLKLAVNKVSISNLNRILGGGDGLTTSVNYLCEVTVEPNTIPDEDCKTGNTIVDETGDFCIEVRSDKC